MKRRLRTGIPAVALAALVAAGVLLATRPWGGAAGGQTTEARACNLVYQIPPESSPFQVFPIADPLFNDGEPGLVVRMKDPRILTDPNTGEEKNETAGAFLDAKTGTVLSKGAFTPSDKALLEEILATIRFDPFDPAAAPWPYSDATTVPPDRQRQRFPPNGGVEIRVPDPGSGIVYSSSSGDDGSEIMFLHTCKSTMRVDLHTGTVLKQDINPEDRAAFETFRAEVQASVP